MGLGSGLGAVWACVPPRGGARRCLDQDVALAHCCDGARHRAQLALALVQKGAARLTLELAVRRSARHLDTVRVGLGGRGRG